MFDVDEGGDIDPGEGVEFREGGRGAVCLLDVVMTIWRKRRRTYVVRVWLEVQLEGFSGMGRGLTAVSCIHGAGSAILTVARADSRYR